MHARLRLVATAAFVAVLAFALAGCAWVVRSSAIAPSLQGNGPSTNPVLSANGTFVAFQSTASNLVPGDTNGVSDIFVRDHVAKKIVRVSVASGGTQANGPSFEPAISEDGRFVAFESDATNLVPGDTNGVRDAFVHDLSANTTVRASLNGGGVQGNGASFNPTVSANGNRVAFESDATNLVAGDSNAVRDGFVRDIAAGTTTRVTVASGGAQANGPSFNMKINEFGIYVAFESDASNLVTSPAGAGDTNQVRDVFFHDIGAVTTQRVSVQTGGGQANGPSFDPSISGDAPFVAFDSNATNLAPGDTGGRDVFVHQRFTLVTTPITFKTTFSAVPSISMDQRYVSFSSDDPTLVPGDTNGLRDVFVNDRQTGVTRRVSTDNMLDQANGASGLADISSDARYVAFESFATNLDPDQPDTNAVADIYTRAAIPPTVTSVAPASGAQGASVPVTITGTGFRPGADVIVTGSGVSAGSIVVVDDTTITATFTITAAAPLGARNVFVGNVGTGPGSTTGAGGMCTACFTVT